MPLELSTSSIGHAPTQSLVLTLFYPQTFDHVVLSKGGPGKPGAGSTYANLDHGFIFSPQVKGELSFLLPIRNGMRQGAPFRPSFCAYSGTVAALDMG